MPSRFPIALLIAASLSAAGEEIRFVPAAASGPGAGGTFWRTNLSLFNPSETATLHVSLGFLPGGRDNRDVAEATVTLGPRTGATYEDVVGRSLGASGGGGLRIRSDGGVQAFSRTYTSSACGTFGVGIPAIGVEEAVANGIVLAPTGNGSRVNAGVLNPSASAVRVTWAAKAAATGALLGQGTIDLPPLGFAQVNDVTQGAVTGLVAVELTAAAPVLGFATVIDAVSGDAVFVAASPDAKATSILTAPYLMAFLGCDSARSGCNDPRNHSVYLAVSPDGAAWSLAPGWTTYGGSVPDVVRRGSTLYIYTPGQLARYHLETGRLDAPVNVTISGGSSTGFVDPSPTLDDNGRIALFFLEGRLGSDPAGCPPGQATCTQRFGSATEVDGSDGARFTVDTGTRVQIEVGQGLPYVGASDPDIFFDGSRWVIYVSHGANTSTWTSPDFRGTYVKRSDLVTDGSGGIPAGHFDAASLKYWTYTHVPRNGYQIIRRAVHDTLDRKLTESDWTTVLSGASIGLGATFNVASPGFAVNAPR